MLLCIRHGEFYRDGGLLFDENGSSMHRQELSEQRYSVHPSPQTDGNFIKQTVRAGRNHFATRQFTHAIKNGKKFCYLYSRKCSNLQSPTYDLSERQIKKGKIVTICEYKAATFNLVTTTFVSDKNCKLECSERDFGVQSTVCGDYNFTTLFSFLLGNRGYNPICTTHIHKTQI